MATRGNRIDYSQIDTMESDSSDSEALPKATSRKGIAKAKKVPAPARRQGVDASRQTQDESIVEEDGAPVKKKSRGRPPKHVTIEEPARDKGHASEAEKDETEISTLDNATSQPPKKKRGRPKAQPVSDDTEDASQLEVLDADTTHEEPPHEDQEPVRPRAGRGRPPKAASANTIQVPSSQDAPSRKAKAQAPADADKVDKRKKASRKARDTVADTEVVDDIEEQPADLEAMDVSTENAPAAQEEDAPAPAVPEPAKKRRGRVPSRTENHAAEEENDLKRKRDASLSDVEDDSDKSPALRRKLGHMTKQVETLQARYEKLYEVGIKEAEANFDSLKEKTKAQAKAAEDLIAALKADLAATRKEVAEAKKLQVKLDKAEEKWQDSQKGIAKIKEKVETTEAENKALRAKLAAARQAAAEAPAANGKVSDSAVKGKVKGKAAVDPKAAAQAAIATLKEDLYSDLTGLIIRDVDQADEGDVFDCIQTGRNGTLHFLLAIDKSDPGASYEEAEFHYKPLIDEQRDKELLEIIPEYLGGEIDFPRASATKFFSRIWDPLTRKLE